MNSNPASKPSSLSSPPPKGNPSHGVKRPPGHINRSPNAFILYRSDFYKRGIIPTNVEQRQQNLSRVVGDCWRRLTPEAQQYWHDLARQKREEHRIKHPDYHFNPMKRKKATRRKPMSPQAATIHCTNLRETFVPDMTGPVLNPPGSRPAPPRKSRAKPRAKETERPARTTRSSRAHAKKRSSSRSPQPSIASEGPVFMDPLIPPSGHPHSQLVGDTAILDPELEPPMASDVPSLTDWEEEDASFPEVLVVPPEPVEIQGPLDAGAHIRQQFEVARRSAVFPTMAMDFQNAEELYSQSSFFASQSTGQQAHVQWLNIPFTAESTEWQCQASNSTTDPSSGGHPPASLPTGLEKFEALPGLSTPQQFPITLTSPLSTQLESLHLRAPEFDTPPDDLSTLTLSFDQSAFDAFAADFGLDDLFNQFGQSTNGFNTDTWPSSDVMNILSSEVCARTVDNV